MINRTLSNIVLGLIVVIWVVPFIALVATSLRSEMATKTSGFWTSFTPTILGHRFSTHDKNEVLESDQLTGCSKSLATDNFSSRIFNASLASMVGLPLPLLAL